MTVWCIWLQLKLRNQRNEPVYGIIVTPSEFAHHRYASTVSLHAKLEQTKLVQLSPLWVMPGILNGWAMRSYDLHFRIRTIYLARSRDSRLEFLNQRFPWKMELRVENFWFFRIQHSFVSYVTVALMHEVSTGRLSYNAGSALANNTLVRVADWETSRAINIYQCNLSVRPGNRNSNNQVPS